MDLVHAVCYVVSRGIVRAFQPDLFRRVVVSLLRLGLAANFQHQTKYSQR